MKPRLAGPGFRFLLVALSLALSYFSPAAANPQSDAEESTVQALRSLHFRYDMDEQDMIRVLRYKALGLATLGEGDMAVSALEETGYTSNEEFTDEIWRLTARFRAIQGETEDALEAARSINLPLLRADALLAIGRAHVRAKKPVEACRLFRSAAGLIQLDPNIDGFAYAACLLAQAGDLPTARRLFKLAQKFADVVDQDLGIPPSQSDDQQTVRFFRFKAGLGREALKTVPEDPRELNTLLRLAANRKDFDLAFLLGAKPHHPWLRAAVYSELGIYAASQGKTDVLAKAVALTEKSVAAALKLPCKPKRESDDLVRTLLELAVCKAVNGESVNPVLQQIENVLQKYGGIRDSEAAKENAASEYLYLIGEPQFLRLFPVAKQPSITVDAVAAAQALPLKKRYRALKTLTDKRWTETDRPRYAGMLQLRVKTAREQAAQAKSADDLWPLMDAAAAYRDIGDRYTSSELLGEAVAKLKAKFRASKRNPFLRCGFFEEAVSFAYYQPTTKAVRMKLAHIAESQSYQTRPAAPPDWLLGLNPAARGIALRSWASYLVRPRLLDDMNDEMLLILSLEGTDYAMRYVHPTWAAPPP